MIKISCVYTATSTTMIEMVERELAKVLKSEYVVTHHTAPDVLSDTVKAGYITRNAASKLINTYCLCMNSKTDIIINICSSVGDIAAMSHQLFMTAGVHIIRIDDEMCIEATKEQSRIGVMATINSTLDPSCRLLLDCAEKNGRDVELVPILVEGAFEKSGDELIDLLCETAYEYKDEYDGLVLTQLSMASCEQMIKKKIGKPVYSSLRFGVRAVADIVNVLQIK